MFGDGDARPVVSTEDGGGGLQQAPLMSRRGGFQQSLNGAPSSLHDAGNAFRVLIEGVNFGTDIGQVVVPRLLEDADTLRSVTEKQCVIVAPHRVLAHGRNLEHLAEFVRIAGEEVEKGEAVEILGPLIGHLHHLKVALAEGLGADFAPAPGIVPLQPEGAFHRRFEVAARQRQFEAGARVFHEMQGHFRASLLCEVGDNGLSTETAVADHLHDLRVLFRLERQFEDGLREVNLEIDALGLPVEGGERVLFHAHNVEGVVDGANDPRVPVGEAVLDVIHGRVDKHGRIAVPRPGFDADGLGDGGELLELPVRDDHPVLADDRERLSVRRPACRAGFGGVDLAEGAAALLLKEDELVLRAQEDAAAGATVEEPVDGGDGGGDLLGHLVLEVADNDLAVLVEGGEAVAADEDSGAGAGAAFPVGD
mmetsp:Transcript_21366/g.42799  ORF Transcript_21366/g.42799 Transcript_21366/m.42799 type:complete len:423 (-) Transcript_21366:799-2067(-)